MPLILTDAQISSLIVESKPLPENYSERILTKAKRGHRERELDVVGENGSEFRIILRQSLINPLDFSVVLAYRPKSSSQVFRLRRYNGKSHEHTNKLENQIFYGFYVHQATLRYQEESGEREDGFAEPTDRYADFQGAVHCLLNECAFVIPETAQAGLF